MQRSSTFPIRFRRVSLDIIAAVAAAAERWSQRPRSLQVSMRTMPLPDEPHFRCRAETATIAVMLSQTVDESPSRLETLCLSQTNSDNARMSLSPA